MKPINNLRRFGDNISLWLSSFPVLYKVYDFDYSGILSVERHQIKRVRNSISHYRNHLNCEQDVASMNLALKLLDIIEKNGEAKMIGYEPFETDEKGHWKPNPNVRWELDRYGNIRNATRFNSKWDLSFFNNSKDVDLIKDQLRVEKARHLYHKLRQYKSRSWWD